MQITKIVKMINLLNHLPHTPSVPYYSHYKIIAEIKKSEKVKIMIKKKSVRKGEIDDQVRALLFWVL